MRLLPSHGRKRTGNTILALIGVDGERGGGGVRNLLFYSSLTEGQTKHESFSQMRDAFFCGEWEFFDTIIVFSGKRSSFKKQEGSGGASPPTYGTSIVARTTDSHSFGIRMRENLMSTLVSSMFFKSLKVFLRLTKSPFRSFAPFCLFLLYFENKKGTLSMTCGGKHSK